MAAKTFVCSICGEEVSRKKSYALGDGTRACRIHEEAQEKHKSIEEDKKKKQQQDKESLELKNRRRKSQYSMKPKCMVCHREGIRQEEYYARILIDMEKLALGGESQSPNEPCLYYVRWAGKNKNIKVPFNTFQTIQMLGTMMGGEAVFFVCSHCVEEKKFETIHDETMKEDNFEKLALHGAIYETYYQDNVRQIAQRELEG